MKKIIIVAVAGIFTVSSAYASSFAEVLGALNDALSTLNDSAGPTPENVDTPNNVYDINDSTNHRSRGHMERVTCSFCGGTGRSPIKEYAPSFGNGRSSENYYHKSCPSCGGKGYTMKFVSY
jgi:hypothetical protein